MGSPRVAGADTRPLSFSSPAQKTEKICPRAESVKEEPEASVGLGAGSFA